MVNLGIIGVGGIAGAHLAGYSTLENARIVALCDKIPERANGTGRPISININTGGSAAVQAKPYLDYRELVKDPEVQAVDICLPTDLHADAAITALEAGKHVLSEKPMALSVEDCDRMIAAAEASGCVLMIAQCLRFCPEYMKLKELVDSGKYGKVTTALFTRLSGMPRWTMDHWMEDPKRCGGGILDLHVHDADFIQYMLGMPKAVMARGLETENGIGNVMVEYQYGEGQAIDAAGGWYYHDGFPFRMNFIVRMEGATIEWNPPSPFTLYIDDCEPVQPELAGGDLYANEIVYFLDCIERGVKPEIVTPFDARESIRLVLAEAESVRTGKPVAL